VVVTRQQTVVPWSPSTRHAAVDVVVETVAVTVRTSGVVARRAGTVARPLVDLVLRPPVVGASLQPANWLEALAHRGEQHRRQAERELASLLDRLVPLVLRAVLDRVDLNQVVREHVDLDGLVATVDIDAVAQRLDVDAVAQRLDVDAVLDRVDLNQVVRERVDLDGLVATVDVAAVIDHLDLRSLAEQVIAEVDLPEIIRASTGSVTSEAVRGVRMRSISGDDAVARAADRFRLRRRPAVPPPAPGTP
jgi:hypothetical protein